MGLEFNDGKITIYKQKLFVKLINTEKSKIQKYIIKMRQIDKTSICLFYVEGWEK